MALLVSLAGGAWSTGCATTDAPGRSMPATSSQSGTSSRPAPEACLDPAAATRGGIEGTPVWARFCPGPDGRTAPAEVPSDALTTYVEDLTALAEIDGEDARALTRCSRSGARTYRVQIGYADDRVTTVVGRTDPDCAGRVPASGARVAGPDRLGVYGLLMAASGRQHADELDDATDDVPLVCPEDPRRPDSVDLDGPSASSGTSYLLGRRGPMTMPLPAVRGIVCTWSSGAEGAAPDVRALTGEEAERVRIGLHAIAGGLVDCAASRAPTRTAVVEDRTGTRRAVTVVGSECSTVIRSDRGYGTGFPWLDR